MHNRYGRCGFYSGYLINIILPLFEDVNQGGYSQNRHNGKKKNRRIREARGKEIRFWACALKRRKPRSVNRACH